MPTTVCRCCGGANSPLRWACPCCARATLDRLREIKDHTIAIATSGHGGVVRPRCESRPPARPSLLSALDDEALRDGDPTAVLLSVLGTLHEVARYVRRQRGEPGDWQCTIDSEVRYLRINAEWCTHQTWGHEFVDVLHQLHTRTATFGLNHQRREAG